MYYIGPNRKQRFRQVIPGALFATLLWLLATLAFSWYVSHVANYNVLYGSVGAGLALLVWMYVLSGPTANSDSGRIWTCSHSHGHNNLAQRHT